MPNCIGRVRAGVDAAALRLTGFATVGAVGGLETQTLTVAQMPAHAHSDSGHAHGDSGHGHSVSDGGHNHYLNMPSHAHSLYPDSTEAASNAGCGCVGGGTIMQSRGFWIGQTDYRQTGDYNSSSGAGIGIYAGYANIATNYAAIQNTGGGGSHPNVQPTIAMNVIIKR